MLYEDGNRTVAHMLGRQRQQYTVRLSSLKLPKKFRPGKIKQVEEIHLQAKEQSRPKSPINAPSFLFKGIGWIAITKKSG